MKYFIVILFAFVTLAFFSCQKEISNIGPLNPPTGVSDGNYLNKVYYYDSSAIGKDTGRICAYYYDNLNRVILYTDSLKFGGITDWYEVNKYFYTGNDSLPFKSERYKSEDGTANPSHMDTTITFYTYNSAGKNMHDSSVTTFRYDLQQGAGPEFETYKQIQTYQYNGNKIYGIRHFTRIAGSTPMPPASAEIRDTATLDTRGNLISSKQYVVTGGQSELTLTSDFTYDDKPSPYARLSNFRTVGVFPFGDTFSEEMQSTNNRLKALETSPTSGVNYDEDLSGLLLYKPNGYIHRIVFPEPTYSTINQFTYR